MAQQDKSAEWEQVLLNSVETAGLLANHDLLTWRSLGTENTWHHQPTVLDCRLHGHDGVSSDREIPSVQLLTAPSLLMSLNQRSHIKGAT
jgi:hypothetical protein